MPTHHEDGHEHQEIRFEAPLPTKVQVAVALFPAPVAHVALPAPAHAAAVVAPVHDAPPTPPPRTVVLLL